MKIKKLPASVRSKIQSGVVVTDAVQCVLELVHNSLDAEATAIAVRIDLKVFQIKVIDNGKGIPRDDLELVGERFMTSKYKCLNNVNTSALTYGFKGQAISSLLDVCKSLTIKTKSKDDGPFLIKTFQNNRSLPITIDESQDSGVGTTVVIEDFMCNMPVRRKRVSEVFDLEEMKTQLQYLAVIHHKVCFTLRNENKGLILLQKPQADGLLQSISHTFGKTIAKHLKSINYHGNNYEISGFISLKPQKQNNLQLLYINKRIITKGVIHKFVINSLKEHSTNITQLGKSLVEKDFFVKKKFSGHYVFILLIKCSYSLYELFTNSRKTTVEFKNWKDVLKCLNRALKKVFEVDRKTSKDLPKIFTNNEKIEPIHETKAKFGTSLLINAIRGAPVKRSLNKQKTNTKKKKRNDNENFIKPNIPVLISENKKKNSLKTKNSDNMMNKDLINYTSDSLESPIPKNQLKGVMNQIERYFNQGFEKNKLNTLDSSSSKFYKWLKIKFKTEASSFNLCNEFLQFDRENVNSLNGTSFNKSPILRPKVLKTTCNKKYKNRKKEFATRNSTINENNVLSFYNKQQLNAAKVQKHFQILTEETTETHTFLPIPYHSELKNNSTSQKKHDKIIPVYQSSLPVMNENQNQLNQTMASTATSEAIFKDLIKLRNLSESFMWNPSSSQKTSKNNFHQSVSNTWISHYEDQINTSQKINGITRMEAKRFYELEKFTCHNYNYNTVKDYCKKRNFNSEYSQESDLEFNFNENYERGREDIRDVEIQTDFFENISNVQKINVMVQTDYNDMREDLIHLKTVRVIPESPSFENDTKCTNLLEKEASFNNNNFMFIESLQFKKNYTQSQEVPHPDFWNVSTPEDSFENENILPSFEPEINLEKIITTELTKSSKTNEKNTSTSMLICSQNFNTHNKFQDERNLSKDMPTLAQMWEDCLQEIGNSESLLETNNQTTTVIPVKEFKISEPEKSNFCFSERHDFIPKGLSPKGIGSKTLQNLILNSQEKLKIKTAINDNENELLTTIKWQDDFTGTLAKPIISDEILDEMCRKMEKNLVDDGSNIISASLSNCAIKIHNLLHSFTFTKELLSNVEILGQLDKKFIVAKMEISEPQKMNLISLFDQHAVDERIRLEEIMKANVTADGNLISNHINPAIDCLLNESIVEIISNSKNKFLEFGLKFKVVNETTISVVEIPAFLLNKYEKNLKNKKCVNLKEVLLDLISDVIMEISETRGAASKIPKTMHYAFCMEACHRAIKFNRTLTKEAMEEMIRKLKNCKLPFQCAHGRPSVIPIIDLEDFKPVLIRNQNLDYEKLKKFMLKRNLPDVKKKLF